MLKIFYCNVENNLNVKNFSSMKFKLKNIQLQNIDFHLESKDRHIFIVINNKLGTVYFTKILSFEKSKNKKNLLSSVSCLVFKKTTGKRYEIEQFLSYFHYYDHLIQLNSLNINFIYKDSKLFSLIYSLYGLEDINTYIDEDKLYKYLRSNTDKKDDLNYLSILGNNNMSQLFEYIEDAVIRDLINFEKIIDNLDSFVVNKLDDYFKLLELLDHANNKYVYRGQADKTWPLMASIYRKVNIKTKEKEIYCNLRKFNFEGFNKKETFIDELLQMQHYGVYTRLLDWSYNPLVGLFFSVNNEHNKDGIIYMYNNDDNQVKIDFNDYNYSYLSEYLESDIFHLNEKLNSDFLKLIENNTILGKNYLFLDTAFINDRIRAQQGCFSIIIDYEEKNSQKKQEINDFNKYNFENKLILNKILISAGCKEQIRAELNKIGINSVTMFPDIEGYAQHFKNI